MDAVQPTSRAPWAKLLLCAVGVAIGWLAISIAFGLGASGSEAAEQDKEDGLLSSLVDTVEDVTGILPDAVSDPVDEVVGAVEKTVTKTVESVTKTVDNVVKAKPVKKVTDAVTRTVKKVPVVGDVADGLGVTDTVDAVGGTVTDVVSGVDRTVDAVVDTVVKLPPSEAASPAVPTDPTDPADPAGVADTPVISPPAPPAAGVPPVTVNTSESAPWRAADATSVASAAAIVGSSVGSVENPLPRDDSAPSPVASPATAVLSSGHSGSAAAAGTVPSARSPHAHNAWLRTGDHADLTAPSGPPSRPAFSPD